MSDPSLIARPERIDAMQAEPVDRVGRKQPRKVTVFTFLRSITGFAGQFRDIPDEFWSLDVNDEGYSEAAVSCPCGQTPRVELGTLQECACDRCFLFIGTQVMVANSPIPSVEPPTPATS